MPAQRRGPFVGIDLGNSAAPDELTICKFRHLIKDERLSQTMLTAINDHLKYKGIRIYAFIAS